MAMPPIVKTWAYDVNNRITYASVNQVMSEALFGIFSTALITAGAFTCVGSSTGVAANGNLSGSNVWASAANCTVRGTSPITLQSWIVIRDGNGWDWLICYQGAGDNNMKISVSKGQLWTLAGVDVARQPTATDECIVATNVFDFIDPTASLDRIWHTAWSSDKKIWRNWIFRNNVMASMIAGEEIVGAVTSAPFTPAVIGWASTTATIPSTTGGVVGLGTTNSGGATQISGINAVGCGGGGESFSGGMAATTFGQTTTDLQSAALIVPVNVSSVTVGIKGLLGRRIDVWASVNNNQDQDTDMYETSTYTGMGAQGVFPWNGTAKVIA
jgi:hypothetical protein